MKRWFAMAVKNWLARSVATVLALGSLSGCQPTFLAKDVFDGAQAALPPRLEENSCPLTDPVTAMTPAPPTVSLPDRLPQYLSLQEAIAIALENGTVSGRNITNLGLIPAPGGGPPSTNAIGFPVSSQNDSMRILALGPAVNRANIEIAASRFDAVFASTISWTGIDGLPGVPNLGGSFQNNSISGGLNNTGGDNARWSSSIIKAFASGGVANFSLIADYRNLNSNGINPVPGNGLLNPQYSIRPSFGFEQPLWRDFGVTINQILGIFPSPSGVTLPSQNDNIAFSQHQGRVGQDGILIARLKFDQSRAHFENNVNTLLANAEIAYWNLYNKYGQLYSFEESLKIIHKAWQQNYDKLKAGGNDPPAYSQVHGQYEEFLGEYTRSLNEVLEAERNLRSVLGLPVEDGSRLVPITPPTIAELKPNWENCIHDAWSSRPDLAWARQDLTKNQHALTVAKNNLKPDLRLFARLEPFGDGSTLTGNGSFLDSSGSGNLPGSGVAQPSNALQSLMGGRLTDYQVGVSLNMPLGFRAEYAAIRVARLELTKSYLLLKDWENQVTYQVAREYQELDHWYRRIQRHRAERLAYSESVQKRLLQIGPGGKGIIGDPAFLEAHRRYTAALVKEYGAIAEYNNTLARLEWAKGTILHYDNVHIGEGALPQCVQVRAVEYEKERTKSVHLRETPDSLYHPGRLCGTRGTEPPSLTALPADEKAAVAPGKQVAPVKQAEPPKYDKKPLPSISTRAWDEKRTAPSKEEKIEFKPSFIPKQQPGPLPPPLPALEGAPLPFMIPPNTSAVPAVTPPSAGVRQVGPAGFVMMDDARMRIARATSDAGTPVPPPYVVRVAIGGVELPMARE